jgi:putative ABC transport system permease protein
MFQNNFKIAFRSLLKYRAYAALNVIGLGVSIACCLLIFLLVQHHLTFDNFHQKLDRIGVIGVETRLQEVSYGIDVPYPMSAALRQEYAFLEKTAMLSGRANSLITIEQAGQAPVKFQEETARAFAEPELFEIFNFPLIRGNMDEFKQPMTALLTEKMAHKYFGSTDAALGKSFKVNNRFDYRVVGVLRDFPQNTDLGEHSVFTSWATLTSDSNSVRMLRSWGGIHGGTHCFVRFRDGYNVQNLENAFLSFREKYFHPEVREWWYHARPMREAHFDAEYGFGVNKNMILALGLIGLFLLITACVNFVNMATAQALNRAREVGVRKTMGSTRGQLFWQFMTETSLIVLFATCIGVFLAYSGLPLLNRLADTNLHFSWNGGWMPGFIMTLLLVVTFLAGAYPGLVLSGFRPAQSLKGGVGMAQAGGFSLRRILVGSQFAISQTLIIAAIVMTAQLNYVHNADLGFQKKGIISVNIPGQDVGKKTTLKQQISTIAGVEQVSLCMQPPASDANWQTAVQWPERTAPEPWSVNLKFADTDYLSTFNVPLVAGRNLQPCDTVREFLINEELLRKSGFTAPEEVVGKMLKVDHMNFQIVGVIKNFHNRSFREDIQPQVIATDTRSYETATFRINVQNAGTILPQVEKVWTQLFPEYVYEQTFMDDALARFYETESNILQLVRLFAIIAVLVGCLGLYGLASFMVTRKTKEVGIRKSLGASVANILWLFSKEYMQLLLLAFAVAAPLAWWIMHGWLQDFAYRISIGASILGASLLLTFIIATVTVGFQSTKAALANPVQSLKGD